MPAKRTNLKSAFAKSLMEKTGEATPENAVIRLVDEKLTKVNHLAPPANLEMLASLCGIDPQIVPCEMQEDGRLIRDGGKWRIQVNERHNRNRQRFSSAHEITHKILKVGHDSSERRCTGIGTFDKVSEFEEEWLCDLGAQYLLLLNSRFLSPIIANMGLSLATIEYVSQSFEVSFEAAARALANHHSEPVAIVYYALRFRQDELPRLQQPPLLVGYVEMPQPKLRIIRAYTSVSFPTSTPRNKSLAETSNAQSVFQTRNSLSAIEEHCFDDKQTFQFYVEATGQTVYHNGRAEDGLIVIFTNPATVS